MEDKHFGLIYKISNTINDKVYIGQTTKKMEFRYSQHNYCHKSIKNNDTKLYNAMRKYGFENFTVEQIDTATTQKELNEKEIAHIKQCDSLANGYNTLLGGLVGHKIWLGKHHSEETKRKMSLSRIGYKFSDESKKKLSATRIRLGYRQASGKDHHSNIEIVQLDINTLELICVYDSIREAEFKVAGRSTGGIFRVLNNRYENFTYSGFKWMKKDDYDNESKPISDKIYFDYTVEDKAIRKNVRFNKNIKVIQLDINYQFIKEWNDSFEASRTLNLDHAKIQRCIDGGVEKTFDNFRFINKEDYENENFTKLYTIFGANMVIQLSLDGKFIKEWISAKEISDNLNIPISTIFNCCNVNSRTDATRGFLWMHKSDYLIEDRVDELVKKQNKRENYKATVGDLIYQIDLSGHIVNSWSSVREASKSLGFRRISITKSLKTDGKIYKGFIWIYQSQIHDFNLLSYVFKTVE